MTNLLIAALLLGTAAGVAAPVEHRTRLDHASGAAEVHYRAAVAVRHRQVGVPAPGGRASTLACRWEAGLVVERDARHASAGRLSRTIERAAAIEGSRPGWCSTQGAAIRQDIARRAGDWRGRLAAIAEEDHHVLRAELDRAQGAAQAG